MSSVELLDTFGVPLAFIFIKSKWTPGWSAFESPNGEDVPPTGLMFTANARNDGRNGKTVLYRTLGWGNIPFALLFVLRAPPFHLFV